MIKFVSQRINDKGFTDLLHKALKAGYLYQGQYFSPEIGTPQGSIISPILCNILLTHFDSFIENIRYDFEVGKRHKTNPEWRRLTRTGNMREVHERNISSRIHADASYKRLKYVRYADDFLIGVIGSYEDCEAIRDKLQAYLISDLGLHLNFDKTSITNARTQISHFLGTDIKITSLNKRPLRVVTRGDITYLAKAATRPQLLAPIKKLIQKLEAKGMARHGGKPTRWGHMLHFDNSHIVNHFKLLWNGISNYYSFADNYGSLGRISYILKYSCVLTLAAKLRLFTAKKVFRKFGKNLNIIVDKKIVASFPDPELAKPRKFHNSKITNSNPMARLEQLTKATFRTRAMFDAPCTLCGSLENIEIHHVRKLKDSSRAIKMDYLTAMMSRMNRKQIPLCKSCHINWHRGHYPIQS